MLTVCICTHFKEFVVCTVSSEKHRLPITVTVAQKHIQYWYPSFEIPLGIKRRGSRVKIVFCHILELLVLNPMSYYTFDNS